MRFLLVGLLAACGGGSGSDGSLDCEYLASSDNCWKVTASAAISCLPPEDAIGVLSADFASCTYATGQVITFTPALTLPLANEHEWNFTMTTDGQPCLAYNDSDEGFELTVGDDTVSEVLTGNGGLALTCPDGSSFSNSNPIELLSCPDSNFGNLPGNTSSSGIDSVSFGLINTGVNTLTIFDCN
ncbi:MAG: hypothetical protein H0V17_15120 [Deltaproteobacteria bacterium]|nr:hypothetical protein [Deltaproteobacteria bacterium]